MAAPEIPLRILRLAEAFIFASPEPVTGRALRPLLPDELDPEAVFAALERHCADRGVILVNTGGAWAFRTAPDLAAELRTVLSETRRLPRVAMEVLAIIALYQPITRPEIEQIRGVGLSQQSLDVLLETGLVQPWGRKEVPGRPTLWVTTPRFLAQFGLRSLRSLPGSQLDASASYQQAETAAAGDLPGAGDALAGEDDAAEADADDRAG
jgi:segregation and condensation protein B